MVACAQDRRESADEAQKMALIGGVLALVGGVAIPALLHKKMIAPQIASGAAFVLLIVATALASLTEKNRGKAANDVTADPGKSLSIVPIVALIFGFIVMFSVYAESGKGKVRTPAADSARAGCGFAFVAGIFLVAFSQLRRDDQVIGCSD